MVVNVSFSLPFDLDLSNTIVLGALKYTVPFGSNSTSVRYLPALKQHKCKIN